jgi:CRP/FNR family transcriptional regulator, cyclic AMP receptor protein
MLPLNDPNPEQRVEDALAAAAGPPSASRRNGHAHRRRPVRMPLMALEPALLKTVPLADRQAAQRVPLVIFHELAPGPLDTAILIEGRMPFGALLVDGAVCRNTALGRHRSCHLFGPGSILRPRHPTAASLPWESDWTCVTDCTMAVLDHDFPTFLARWPALSEHVQHQLALDLEATLCQCAWTGLSRVDDRILALFWHLADVWGTVGPGGVAIRLPLTHRMIGRLVAAERATISLALARLGAKGLLVKTEANVWLLSPESQQLLIDG